MVVDEMLEVPTFQQTATELLGKPQCTWGLVGFRVWQWTIAEHRQDRDKTTRPPTK